MRGGIRKASEVVARAADIGTKRLISLAPDAWARWVMQRDDVVAKDLLAEEFKWVSRRTDALMRAATLTGETFLILTEIQSTHDPRMPRRMHAYAALAEEHYNLPVFPVVVNIAAPLPGTVIATRYESTFRGLYARRDYHVINLWEIDAEAVVQQPVPPLLPFVPMLRGGANQQMIRRALVALHGQEHARDFEPLLGHFASIVLGDELATQIVRLDMVVIEQTAWYHEFQKTQNRRQILRLLEHRFGPLPSHIAEGLQQQSLEQLDRLVLAVLDVPSLEAFETQLEGGNSIQGN